MAGELNHILRRHQGAGATTTIVGGGGRAGWWRFAPDPVERLDVQHPHRHRRAVPKLPAELPARPHVHLRAGDGAQARVGGDVDADGVGVGGDLHRAHLPRDPLQHVERVDGAPAAAVVDGAEQPVKDFAGALLHAAVAARDLDLELGIVRLRRARGGRPREREQRPAHVCGLKLQRTSHALEHLREEKPSTQAVEPPGSFRACTLRGPGHPPWPTGPLRTPDLV